MKNIILDFRGCKFPRHEKSYCLYVFLSLTLIIYVVAHIFNVTIPLLNNWGGLCVYLCLYVFLKLNSIYDHLVIIFVKVCVTVWTIYVNIKFPSLFKLTQSCLEVYNVMDKINLVLFMV